MAWMVFDYPESREKEPEPVCPMCGGTCGRVYRDRYMDIVGCEECVTMWDAWETAECVPAAGRGDVPWRMSR